MIRIILFTCLVGLLVAQVPRLVLAEDAPPALPGRYDCSGTDGNGSGYHSTVRIEKHADVYYLEWRVAAGPTAMGIGILDGDVLAVSYYGRTAGVVLYRIDGTTLAGHWTDTAAPGRLFEETLRRIPHDVPDDPEPASRYASGDRTI